MAEDGQLNRKVVLKRMKSELVEDQNSRARFMDEAQITGYLEHPNIAPVYALGRDREKLPFYAMRFIEGKSLEDAIKQFHSPHSAGTDHGKRLLALGSCWGISSPCAMPWRLPTAEGSCTGTSSLRNVMLGPYGETMLVDWGLAKVVGTPGDSAAGLTQEGRENKPGRSEAGSVLGTLFYMSPEQAEPAEGRIGPASDVYSLGSYILSSAHRPPSFRPQRQRRTAPHGDPGRVSRSS